MSTDGHATAASVIAKTKAHRAAELALLTKYGEWADVKDAIQTVLAWSFMYDPKEGLVAPEFPCRYTSKSAVASDSYLMRSLSDILLEMPGTYSPSRGGVTGGGFAHSSIDGDTQEGLFCCNFTSHPLIACGL